MVFSSIHFLFLFLPVLLLFYFVIKNTTWRNLVMVGFSLVFFAWTDPKSLPILVFCVIANYLLGLIVGLLIEKNDSKKAKAFLWTAVFLNLSLLFFFKYLASSLGLLLRIVNIESTVQSPALPLGISYFIFSGLSYLFDIYYRVEKPEINFLRFSTYMVMFPKLLQGPITKFGQVKNELVKPDTDYSHILDGVRRFILGLAKKVLIADLLAVAANKVINKNTGELGAGVAWFGLIAYALQIYFDFSGYTDMAIGLGKIFGFKLPENFNFPYISRSITEFWRRWHMTLSDWFRSYVFIPLEFARKREKHFRQQSNILIVFLLTGLWHGSSWNFILWGVYYGIILAIEASGFGKVLKKIPRPLQHLYSLIVILLGWVIFRIDTLAGIGRFLSALAGANGFAGAHSLRELNIVFYFPVMILAVFLSLPWLNTRVKQWTAKSASMVAVFDLLYLCLFLVSVAQILSSGFQSFLYGQF